MKVYLQRQPVRFAETINITDPIQEDLIHRREKAIEGVGNYLWPYLDIVLDATSTTFEYQAGPGAYITITVTDGIDHEFVIKLLDFVHDAWPAPKTKHPRTADLPDFIEVDTENLPEGARRYKIP